MRVHLAEVGTPERSSQVAAADVIREEYEGFGGRKNALGICMELPKYLNDATFALAALFDSKNKKLPSRWKSNPEIARTVVSMCGILEIGLRKAQQIDTAHLDDEGEDDDFQKRIDNIEKLVNDLQQK